MSLDGQLDERAGKMRQLPDDAQGVAQGAEAESVSAEAKNRLDWEKRERAIEAEMRRIKGAETKADQAALAGEIQEMGPEKAAEFILNHRNTIRAGAVDLGRFANAGQTAKMEKAYDMARNPAEIKNISIQLVLTNGPRGGKLDQAQLDTMMQNISDLSQETEKDPEKSEQLVAAMGAFMNTLTAAGVREDDPAYKTADAYCAIMYSRAFPGVPNSELAKEYEEVRRKWQ